MKNQVDKGEKLMITPKSLSSVKPGLCGEDEALNEFLERTYDHNTQMRNIGQNGPEVDLYPTSTRFDGDST
jgi:hypothetical protein